MKTSDTFLVNLHTRLTESLTAINALAATHGLSARVEMADRGKGMRVELPLPNGRMLTIRAELKYGKSEWSVTASGSSWSMSTPSDFAETNRALSTASAIITILNSFPA